MLKMHVFCITSRQFVEACAKAYGSLPSTEAAWSWLNQDLQLHAHQGWWKDAAYHEVMEERKVLVEALEALGESQKYKAMEGLKPLLQRVETRRRQIEAEATPAEVRKHLDETLRWFDEGDIHPQWATGTVIPRHGIQIQVPAGATIMLDSPEDGTHIMGASFSSVRTILEHLPINAFVTVKRDDDDGIPFKQAYIAAHQSPARALEALTSKEGRDKAHRRYPAA